MYMNNGDNDNKCWESHIDISKDDKCPHISGDRAPKVVIPYIIWQKIMALTKELDTEWLGYLGGTYLPTGEWKVTNITVPKQEVTSSTCKVTDSVHSEGVIHSHANLSCFFSGTDDSYLNENHEFSIVVNKDAETKAVVRMKLPCGALSLVEADVAVEYPAVKDAAKFIEEARKNIEEEPKQSSWGTESWESDVGEIDDDDTNGMGVPTYIPPKERKKNLKPWDYGEKYGDLGGWY